jgi:hypothetical protein
MLDGVTKILAVASAIAVVALSFFNIGYFSKIGFHFLGIVDLNNLVYAFGLAMLALWILAVPVVIYANTFSKPMSETSIRRTTRATKPLGLQTGAMSPAKSWPSRIIELAQAGERNPDLLCEIAVKELRLEMS